MSGKISTKSKKRSYDKEISIASDKTMLQYKDETKGFYQLTSKQKKEMEGRKSSNWVKKIREIKTIHDISEYQSLEALPEVEEEKLWYVLLARLTRDYQSICVQTMTKIERTNEKGDIFKRPEPSEPQTYKFLFLVDNSGSMNGTRMTFAINILVILLEAMKRLEFQTAVVRYGGEKSQVTLKHFTQCMDEKRGQLIIEALDASENTRTADALRYVAETKELYKETKASNEHRFIILISDGIWDQKNHTLYNENLSKSASRLLVLTMNPRYDKHLQEDYKISVEYAKNVLNSIAPDAWYAIMEETNLEEQVGRIASMIDNQLRDTLREFDGTVEKNLWKTNGLKVRYIHIFTLIVIRFINKSFF